MEVTRPLFIFSALVVSSMSLKCYSGWQIWSDSPPVNNVTLVECMPHHRCCSMISSLPGTNYACYDECPASNYHKCGPDPKLGIQDVYYCYCKDYTDPDCKPYLGESHNRQRR